MVLVYCLVHQPVGSKMPTDLDECVSHPGRKGLSSNFKAAL